MADQTTDQTVESPQNTAYYPQDASVDKLNILMVNGDSVDVKKIMIELGYFEDLYSFVASGYVILRDAVGIIEKLQLTGKEFIEVNFGKTSGANINEDKVFRLYGVPKRTPAGNLNTEYIKLYFCSEELLLNEQIKVPQAYASKDIKYIINDILVNKMKVNPNKIDLQDTVGLYDFNVPLNKKPFEVISWLSTYARPASTNLVGADMLFYENKKGFNFKSLSYLYQQPVYNTYSYQQKNIETESFSDEVNTVLEYEFVKTFNSLQDASAGTFANKLISLDPMNRTKKVTNFDYNSYIQKATSLNGTNALSTAPNRLGLTQNQAYDGVIKLAIGNSGQKLKPYYQQGLNSIAQDIYIENFVPSRTAQLALANYTVVKLRIPGDSRIMVGQTINFNLMTLMDDAGQKALDKYYSGKYLVTAVRHLIQSQGVFQTILEISKESPATALQSVDPSSTSFSQAYSA